MKGRDNRAAGIMARSAGEAHEAEIELICGQYRKQKRAKIHKVDPPIRIVRRGKQAIGIPQPSPFVDWLGCWTERGGRLIHIESKSTREPRLPLLTKEGLKGSQYDNLIAWHRAGAIVGVLWGHAGGMKLISLPTIAHAIESEQKSLKWRHHRSCRRGTGLVTWDFLTDLDDC